MFQTCNTPSLDAGAAGRQRLSSHSVRLLGVGRPQAVPTGLRPAFRPRSECGGARPPPGTLVVDE